jgi:hypothetical protein
MYKNNFLEKTLVCVILLLFIGLGVPSGISRDIGTIRIRSVEEVSTTFPLNNDYVLAYWKFNEGSGNNLGDSSGNNLDGTISGATWTTGYSGYALDFDGVDDYVALDSYSTILGINKTDDLIFSVYFNSTSTEPGMIYCIAGTNHVPEARIELLSNGTLLFKIWTSMCGISVYSDNTFNNGFWHNVSIFFNGITANPNVKMYVDGDLEANVTEWLCEIGSSDFKKAKIGRRAYSEEAYFDGLIDEFKIIKYPGGNEQEPPNISGPTHGDPSVEYDFTFVTDDPENDEIWLHIDWGDGNETGWIGPYDSGEEVVVSYEWAEEGEYDIKAESKDIWDDSTWSQPHKIRIGNQPPTPPNISGPQFGDAGAELTYTFVSEDFEGEDLYYNVSWGDGEFEDWFGPYPSGEEVTANHTWDSEDDYEITAKARDSPHEKESDWSDPYPIRIGDEPPSAPQITGETTGGVGVDYNYTFKSTDPEGDKLYYWIEWFENDSSAKWEGPYTSGKKIIRNHTWYEKGTYTIRAKAKDVFGAESDWGTLKVKIPRTYQINKQSTKPFFFQFLQRLIQNLH